ncbi:MAG: SIR2 family protein [Bryobacterales bacterium]|nr:SIR2 family protein [Bryobacterales bacterium]
MARTTFKHDELVFLLGAGASVEAGIPDSNEMVRRVEQETTGGEWQDYLDLYRYLRSSVFYADGLEGITGSNVPFNIERLVNVLDELRKKERHTLYPFVGAWNPKLQDVAGPEFERVHVLRRRIVRVLLRQWVALAESESADYYRGLLRFQEEFGHALRVFSLNYDLCVEMSCGYEAVQRGFMKRVWDWRMFNEGPNEETRIFLYKLHGSLDWYLTENGSVSYSDSPSKIADEQVALIFGTSYKLQYLDPFLFLAYELRRWTLEAARLIVAIGYGFMDEHINGILGQALRQDDSRRLLAVVAPPAGDRESEPLKFIENQLDAQPGQVHVNRCGARNFLNERLSVAELAGLFPEEEDLIEELGDGSVS